MIFGKFLSWRQKCDFSLFRSIVEILFSLLLNVIFSNSQNFVYDWENFQLAFQVRSFSPICTELEFCFALFNLKRFFYGRQRTRSSFLIIPTNLDFNVIFKRFASLCWVTLVLSFACTNINIWSELTLHINYIYNHLDVRWSSCLRCWFFVVRNQKCVIHSRKNTCFECQRVQTVNIRHGFVVFQWLRLTNKVLSGAIKQAEVKVILLYSTWRMLIANIKNMSMSRKSWSS